MANLSIRKYVTRNALALAMLAGVFHISPVYAQQDNGTTNIDWDFEADNADVVKDDVEDVTSIAQPEQSGRPPSNPDFITIGIGAGIGPSYEGSNDYEFKPGPYLQGRVSGIEFAANGPGLTFDLIPDKRGQSLNFAAGPLFQLRFDRDGDTEDDVVNLLSDRDVAFELGGQIGISKNSIVGDFDSVSFNISAQWDVAGAHKGMIISPSLGYSAALGLGDILSFSLSADYADGDYMDYYFSVDAADSLASGLPQYQAKSDWKNIGLSAIFIHDFDGNLRNKGWSGYIVTNYKELLGDARHNPLTSIRGSHSQFFAILGVAYTF